MRLENLPSNMVEHGIEYIVAVPCSELAEILRIISFSNKFEIILPQREDEAIALMGGLGISGKKCLGIFQDSAFGNSTIILSFLQQFNDVRLNLWIGSRLGNYLNENPDHIRLSNITEEIQLKLDFQIESIEFFKTQKLFSITDTEKLSDSLVSDKSILQWKVQN